MADVSMSLGEQDWFNMARTRLGVRGTYRTLDQYSHGMRLHTCWIRAVCLYPILRPPASGMAMSGGFRTYIQITI